MDSSHRPERERMVTRPDTVGVGWPVAPRWDDDPAEPVARLLLTVGVVIWAPLSLFVAFVGAVALGGWQSGGAGAVPGAFDRPTLDNVATSAVTVITFLSATAAFAVARRRVAQRPRGASLLFGIVAACWAPAVAAVLLASA